MNASILFMSTHNRAREDIDELENVYGFVTKLHLTFVIPTRLPCPCDFPSKNTGVSCHFLLQGIFPMQGSNPGLLLCR